MSRPHTVLQSDFPYHVGARCINKDWFSIPMSDVWQIMSEQLHFIHHAFNVKILAFVLMNNHFHLLIQTPDANLSSAIGWFMRETSRALTRAGNRINQTYGGRYYRSIIGTDHYYLNAYKYLYHNPIKAGICEDVLNYPYSTLPGVLGQHRLLVPVEADHVLMSNVESTLKWLNSTPQKDHWETVKRALHRKWFRLPKVSNRSHPLETETL